jgi:hypothetical protein
MAKSANISGLGIFSDILKDIVFFPFWWYSVGLFNISKGLVSFIANKERSLGLGVWIKNIFVPMFGQRDIQGKIISFFIRLIQIIFRSIFLFFWILIAIIGFWLWIIFPALIIYMIIIQF